MDKLLLFPSRTEKGIFTYVIDAEKNYLEKTASEYNPIIAEYIHNAKPMKGKTQVLLTALGAGEYWGCFLEGTPVLMGDGTEKNIEEIESGDLVWTHKNKTQQVLRPMGRHYQGYLYSFGFRSWGNALECTDEHPIYGASSEVIDSARKGYYKQRETYEGFISQIEYVFRPAKEWKPGDYVCVPFPTETTSNPSLSQKGWDYLMGWYLAEGALLKNYQKPGLPYHKVIWTLSGDEGDVALKIKAICEEHQREVLITEGYGGVDCIRVEVIWSELAQECHFHLGAGSKNKRLSTDILSMPREWQLEFLSAYLDGDGCQVKGRGRYQGSLRSSTVSKKLAVDLCKLSARLGYASSFFKCRQHHTCTYSAGNTIYENSYARSLSLELNVPSFDKVGSEKRSGMSVYVDQERGQLLIPIMSVSTRYYEGDVFNLEVACDNSYCVNSFAVHNCNVNGDYFPEDALAHEGDDYGYKTFEKYARLYRHHINKPTSESYGEVLLSVYNPVFHRVELIVTFNHSNAFDLAQRIENGESVDFSMGCKVPYDVCNICGNKAPTRAQYCEHLRYHMGRYIPALGKIAYAINYRPKFFDISAVLIGADRIAKSLRKVASPYYGNLPILSSAYLAEKMAASKRATITKEIPAKDPPSSRDTLDTLAKSITQVKAMEEPMPKQVLNDLAEHPLPKVMSTMLMMGILPKPQEFQRIYLVRHGHEDLADKLDQRNLCFDPMSVSCPSEENMSDVGVDHRNFSEFLMNKLLPFMEGRSYAAPHLGRRLVVMIKRGQEYPQPSLIKVSEDERKPLGPLLPLLAAAGAYAALMKAAPKSTITGVGKILSTSAGVGLATALGLGLVKIFNTVAGPKMTGQFSSNNTISNPDTNDMFARIEALKQKPFTKVGYHMGSAAKRLFLGVPAAYMASGVLQKHKELSPYDEEGRIKRFVRLNPDVISAALIADAVLSAKGHPISTRGAIQHAKNVLKGAGKSGVKMASELMSDNPLDKIADAQDFLSSSLIWPLAMGKTNLPGRIVEGLFDQAALEAGSRLLKKHKKESPKTQHTMSGNH